MYGPTELIDHLNTTRQVPLIKMNETLALILVINVCIIQAFINNDGRFIVGLCRDGCLLDLSVDGQQDTCVASKTSDCSMCWDMCELLVEDAFSWSPLCQREQHAICPAGCQVACRQIFGRVTQLSPLSTRGPSTTGPTVTMPDTEDDLATDAPIIELAISQRSTKGVLVVRATVISNLTDRHVELHITKLSTDKIGGEGQVYMTSLKAPDYVLLPSLTYNSHYQIDTKTDGHSNGSTYFSTLHCDDPDRTGTVCRSLLTPKPHTYYNRHSAVRPSTHHYEYFVIAATTLSGILVVQVVLLLCQQARLRHKATKLVGYLNLVKLDIRTASRIKRTVQKCLRKPRETLPWTGSFEYLPQCVHQCKEDTLFLEL